VTARVADPDGLASLTLQYRFDPATTTTNLAMNDVGNYTVVISNSVGSITSSVAVLTVSCPAITVGPTSLPNGTVLAAYNQTNTASGGSAPYSFAVTSGSPRRAASAPPDRRRTTMGI
jgi:hypothetical protein